MPRKKKATEKSESKPEAPQKVLRQIDSNTQLVSDNPKFPEVKETLEEKLEKGMVRVDAHNVITVR